MSDKQKFIEEIFQKNAVLSERINKLEKMMQDRLDPTAFVILKEKITALEIEINTVRALGSRAYHPKKPHKCPVCEGSGKDKGKCVNSPTYEFAMEYASCHACEGKGIIWG